MRRWRIFVLIAIICVATAGLPAQAHWPTGTTMPVSRLLKNIGDYVAKHPTDAKGYYMLGRVQSAAFAMNVERLNVYTKGPLPQFPPDWPPIAQPRRTTRTLTRLDLKLIAGSLESYKKATELDPKSGLAWFGLGFECEEALRFRQALKIAAKNLEINSSESSGTSTLKEAVRQISLDAYRKAFSLTVSEDLLPIRPFIGYLVSQESAEAVIRLQSGRSLTKVEQDEIVSLNAKIKDLRAVKRGVTPILIDLQHSADISELLSRDGRVKFDLSGEHAGQLWPWVKPTTGILVWDPNHTGKITSGLQLFGNVTWWLFWEDGYSPLAALDNDHNAGLRVKSWMELQSGSIEMATASPIRVR